MDTKQRSEKGENLVAKHGLIAFFDILGYRKLLANNDPAETAKLIKGAFHEGLKKLRAQLTKVCGADFPKYLILSDSIVVYQQQSECGEFFDDLLSLQYFVGFCQLIAASMFNRGLPLRGAIARGKFYADESCFAGKPFIEAYELANSLELSACALAPSAEGLILKTDEHSPKNGDYFKEDIRLYQTPLKGSQKQSLYLLDYRRLMEHAAPIQRAEVLKQFSAHQKDIGIEVYGKFNNTLEFLMGCKSRTL